jgi:hypothetical protein
MLEKERVETCRAGERQITGTADGLRGLVQWFDIPLFSRESGLGVLVDALGCRLKKDDVHVSEQLLMVRATKRNANDKHTFSRLHCKIKGMTTLLWTVNFPRTQVIITNHCYQRCSRLLRHTATTLGDITIPRVYGWEVQVAQA